jgi:hypothetical protein
VVVIKIVVVIKVVIIKIVIIVKIVVEIVTRIVGKMVISIVINIVIKVRIAVKIASIDIVCISIRDIIIPRAFRSPSICGIRNFGELALKVDRAVGDLPNRGKV